MPPIKVYSKPNCPQCDFTKKLLNQKGLHYEPIDISESDEGLETVRSLGYQQVPVVVVGDQNWSGFRPDLIQALAVA